MRCLNVVDRTEVTWMGWNQVMTFKKFSEEGKCTQESYRCGILLLTMHAAAASDCR